MHPSVEAALTRLAHLPVTTLDEYKDAITRECCALAQSTISYFATVNDAQDVLTMIGWSKSAMMNCAMIEKPIVYPLPNTGLWGDAIRERRAVITNDYKSLVKPTKKGYPAGHVNVRRHMNLPIFEGENIVLVVGVGNKMDDYTEADADLLNELMTHVWPHLRAKL